jgi:hypothetical protein
MTKEEKKVITDTEITISCLLVYLLCTAIIWAYSHYACMSHNVSCIFDSLHIYKYYSLDFICMPFLGKHGSCIAACQGIEGHAKMDSSALFAMIFGK